MIGTAVLASVIWVGGTGSGITPPASDDSMHRFADPFFGTASIVVEQKYAAMPWDNPRDSVPLILDAATLHGADGVVCLSKGSQVCRAAEALDTDPDRTWVLLADPDGPTGISRQFGFSGDYAPPTHNTHVVIAEYDGVADWPDRPLAGFGLSGLNAAIGGFAPGSVHQRFGDNSDRDPLQHLDDAEVTVEDNGNGTTTTTHFVRTATPPLIQMIEDTEFTLTRDSKITNIIREPIRHLIDAGYDRKATDNEAESDDPANDAGDVRQSVRVQRSAETEPERDSESESSSGSDDSDASAKSDSNDSDGGDDA